MSNEVFISFSSKDKKFAEKIYTSLKKTGISCWISSQDIPAGADYQACIVEAIEKCELVVLIFSSNANCSNEIAKELSLSSKKIVIPVRIEDVMPAGAFQYQLSNRQFIDLYDNFEAGLDDLAARISATLESKNPDIKFNVKVNSQSKFRSKYTVALVSVGLITLSAVGWLTYDKFHTGKTAEKIAQSGDATKENSSPTLNSSKSNLQEKVVDENKSQPGKLSVQVGPATTVVKEVTLPKLNEISPKVQGVLNLLKESNGYAREAALKTMVGMIPPDLNAVELQAFLKGTENNRSNVIGLLSEKLSQNQTGQDISLILGDAEGYSREISIKHLLKAEKVKQNLLSVDGGLILKGMGSSRSNAIGDLAENFAPNQNSDGIAVIIGDTEGYSRELAIRSLSKAGKIKNNLSPENLVQILKGSSSSRSNLIGVLAENVAPNQTGEGVAKILGDLEGYGREVSIKSLSKAGKIKTGLIPDDFVQILKDSGSSRANSIGVLAENAAPNQSVEGVAKILGDLQGYGRDSVMKILVNAGVTPK